MLAAMRYLLVFAVVLLAAAACAPGQEAVPTNAIVAPGAKLEKLAGGFKFTEGPTYDRDGNVFFTDQPNNRIMQWSVDGRLSTFLQPAGRSNSAVESTTSV